MSEESCREPAPLSAKMSHAAAECILSMVERDMTLQTEWQRFCVHWHDNPDLSTSGIEAKHRLHIPVMHAEAELAGALTIVEQMGIAPPLGHESWSAFVVLNRQMVLDVQEVTQQPPTVS